MSRIGRQIITIPENVTVKSENSLVTVTGPKGVLTYNLPVKIEISVENNQLKVTRLAEDKQTRSNHGSVRAHLNNMIKGVVDFWVKELEIRGTGYKASVADNKLTVLAGYIHPVYIIAPEGITISVAEESKVTVSGCDREVVGQVASNIRKIRTPEPYKGKGIRYKDEFIKLKAGKTAKA
ncbi:MAG: 50S ribosomal protein L6 [Candidatus Shapirobacteria bacterium GW2011_GWE1_38_10]|uniref:50S ribosomal protein L6 n=1 Tax=Candidatus Shapirobacteria bacterium GW2011_GWE1_38_10 TaxID=1618488 RepID=A0A0G0KLW1_9BACT|nr:MAG: 50S ribosomal protein L6 [Candidatus Shapirobacteria bacterium GW2011_GWF2_37_20]KKQ50154.1 MAG: 50S ribosomal protein L6 [Candidatus Shapirobacteria bacterium GW2011_GWE1_38_10]KKQ64748.1 MAG: 50S ribosomal protein L6 [Candidatus Shapirobacteria bacterium GW2011_GWF1_38_23]HBP50905.1 50S ribosomal protein L6 [Candidatus Shapirobacteria bacterium]